MALAAPDRRVHLLGLTLANLLWGGSYAVIRVTVEHTPPGVLAALATAAAAALVWALHLVRGRPGPAVPLSDALRMAVLGNIGVTLNLLLTYQGLTLTGATDASLLIVGETLATVLLAVVLYRERVHLRAGAGILLGLLGVALVLWGAGVSEGGAARVLGNVLLLGSTLSDAVYNVLGARLAREYDPATFLRWALTGTLPVWAALLAWSAVAGDLPAMDLPLVAGVVWIAAVQTVLCFTLWFAALARLGTHAGAVSVALQPVAGVLVGVLVLGETLSPQVIAGGVCVVVALLVTASSDHP